MIPSISVGWYSCASTTSSGFDVFKTTFDGESDGRSWSSVFDNSASAAISVNSAALTSGGAGFSSGHSAAASASSTPKPMPTLKKSSNAGAIAGGVVGGLAAIGLAVVAVVFLLSRRKHKRADGTAGAAAATGPAGGPGPNMSQQQYGASGHGHDAMGAAGAVGAAGFYNQHKQDHGQQQYQNADGTYLASGKGNHDSMHQQNSPLSPAPPYANGHDGASTPASELPGDHIHSQAPLQQSPTGPMSGEASTVGGQQHYNAYQAPAELSSDQAYPRHSPAGNPVYEAPS